MDINERALLQNLLFVVLSENSGKNKYEILNLVRNKGCSKFSTSDINSVLYGAPQYFKKDESILPIWELTEGIDSLRNKLLLSEILPQPNLKFYKGYPPRQWQIDSLLQWIESGRKGVVEAVTGTGKTVIGILAAADAIARGMKVLVIVPGTELLDQWRNKIETDLPLNKTGVFGAGHHDEFKKCDILISTVQSACKNIMLPANTPALLIADEVHRYGSEIYKHALEDGFCERLGLTATFERNDQGIEEVLAPYFFNGIKCTNFSDCVIHGCGYARGIHEGILAPFRIGLIGLELSLEDMEKYCQLDISLYKKRLRLIEEFGCIADPFGEFIKSVKKIAEGANGDLQATITARKYLFDFGNRRKLLSDNPKKIEALKKLVPLFFCVEKTLIFTETAMASIQTAELLSENNLAALDYGCHLSKKERKARLAAFSSGNLKILSAPKALDEGVDVAEADLGIILSASQTKRQMIQRMGRVIRPKSDMRPANFIILYFRNTSEDHENGAYEGYLNEMNDHAEDVKIFLNPDENEILEWYLKGLKR